MWIFIVVVPRDGGFLPVDAVSSGSFGATGSRRDSLDTETAGLLGSKDADGTAAVATREERPQGGGGLCGCLSVQFYRPVRDLSS
jgi:hypothetical protein